MGERFGFYTMMAILTLFLMSKFGLDKTNAGLIYSVFYFSIYILAFVGGLIADKTRNYKGNHSGRADRYGAGIPADRRPYADSGPERTVVP